MKSTNQQTGQEGVDFVIRHVDCPNCGNIVTPLPKNYPLLNLQCTYCSFRAHVKTSTIPPREVLQGAGWNILNGILKCGYLVPPLIVNYCWSQDGVEKREVRFYPFIPKKHIKVHALSSGQRQAGYKMFDYVGLDKLPYLKMEVHKNA